MFFQLSLHHIPAAGLTLLSIFFLSKLFSRSFLNKRTWVTFITAICVLCLGAYYIFMAIWYLLKPSFLDHMEPGVAIVARMIGYGRQIYHPFESPERYTELYGPMLYIINYLFQCLNDDIIFSTKLSGVVLALSSLTLLTITMIKQCSLLMVVLQIGFFISSCLWFGHYTYWNKADPLVIFCSVLACSALFIKKSWLSVLILSIAIAVSVNAKIHAFIYIVPFLVHLLLNKGFKHTGACLMFATVFIVLPFLFLNSFSAYNFLQWMALARNHPLSDFVLYLNVKYALLLFLPVMMIALYGAYKTTLPGKERKSLIGFTAAMLFSMAAACVLGSKTASGPHHFLPLVPCLLYLMWLSDRKTEKRISHCKFTYLESFFAIVLLVIWLTASSLTIYRNHRLVFPFFMENQSSHIRNELNQIRGKYAGMNMQMGYGDGTHYQYTWLRPLLYEKDNDYLLDAPAIIDWQMTGVKIPVATLQTIASQKYDVWIIPKGGLPFSLKSPVRPYNRLFEQVFTDTFLEQYCEVKSLSYYSVWMAKRLLNKYKASE